MLLLAIVGFTVADGEDYVDPTVRSRFIVGRVKREQPVTVLTITLLMRSEFASVPPGTQVYDAHLLAPNHTRRWTSPGGPPAHAPVAKRASRR